MPYIGSTPTTQNFISGTDYFNGTGAQTAFTLTRTVNSVNDIQVVVNNVVQQPNDAYTLSGTTLTFTSAPSSGTNNVYVRYLSTTLQSITPSYGSIIPSMLNPPNTIYWNTSGNVGIGTTTITSGAGWSPRLVLAGTDTALIVKGGSGQESNFGTSGGLYIDCLGNSTGTNNNIVFRNTSTNSSYTANERMRIDSGGNVGIGTNTTTDAGVTITTSVTRDSTWDAKLALQSTGATDFPALFFSGCSGTSRYGGIIQTTSTSGNNPAQITAGIGFVNTSSTACDITFSTNGNVGTTNATERMRILSSGNILSLAGGSTTATGTGIAFPATQSASSDANTLDDYEEGSFTPIIEGQASAGTYVYDTTNTFGRYQKIGNRVNFDLSVGVSSVTSAGSGNLYVSNLPFVSQGFTNYYASCSVGYFVFVTTGWNGYYISCLTLVGSSKLSIYYSGTSSSVAMPISAMNGASYLYVSGSYLCQ